MAFSAWVLCIHPARSPARKNITPLLTAPSSRNSQKATDTVRRRRFTRPRASAWDTSRDRARVSPAVDTISSRL